MRHINRSSGWFLFALWTLLGGCVQVQEGGAGLGQPPASDELIYCDPGPEFRAARDDAATRTEISP
jgi:hypothetical protein